MQVTQGHSHTLKNTVGKFIESEKYKKNEEEKDLQKQTQND